MKALKSISKFYIGDINIQVRPAWPSTTLIIIAQQQNKNDDHAENQKKKKRKMSTWHLAFTCGQLSINTLLKNCLSNIIGLNEKKTKNCNKNNNSKQKHRQHCAEIRYYISNGHINEKRSLIFGYNNTSTG